MLTMGEPISIASVPNAIIAHSCVLTTILAIGTSLIYSKIEAWLSGNQPISGGNVTI